MADEKEDEMANELMARQNEIVIYQPDDTMRLEVKLADDSVWLSQEQMIELFQRDRSVISRHIRNAFQEGEVDEANCLHFLQTNQKGRPEAVYNLDVVISVGYRLRITWDPRSPSLKHDPFCYNTNIRIDLEIAKYATTKERDFRCGAGV